MTVASVLRSTYILNWNRIRVDR